MELLSKINQYLGNSKEFALVTIVDFKGSTPREIGAKMIVFNDGSIEGTIGGGKVEYQAINDAVQFIRKKTCGMKEYLLNKKNDLLCGGKINVFIETFSPEKKIIIVGAGHISIALSKIAHMLGFRIIIIDERKDFANKKRFSYAENIIVDKPNKAIKKINIDNNTYIVIITHGHKYDYEALREVCGSKAKYIGMIGSSSKIKNIFKRLMEEGVKKECLKKVFAPIGFNLGGQNPEEIAVSIMAQIISVYSGIQGDIKFKKLV